MRAWPGHVVCVLVVSYRIVSYRIARQRGATLFSLALVLNLLTQGSGGCIPNPTASRICIYCGIDKMAFLLVLLLLVVAVIHCRQGCRRHSCWYHNCRCRRRRCCHCGWRRFCRRWLDCHGCDQNRHNEESCRRDEASCRRCTRRRRRCHCTSVELHRCCGTTVFSAGVCRRIC